MDMRCLLAHTQTWGGVRLPGVRLPSVGLRTHDCMGRYLHEELRLAQELWRELPGPQGTVAYTLSDDAMAALMPGHDTLHLAHLLNGGRVRSEIGLEREIAVALLGSPEPLLFASAEAFASHVRVLRRIAQAAWHTAVAFKTEAAERPAQYWHYDEDAGFLLQPHAGLREALQAATQPSVTGALYDFSCYRASEYVILLGLAEEMEAVHPALLSQLEARSRRRAIRSREFHDVFLDETGSLEAPVPARYFVPGDRLWFRNPDGVSSDAMGYEGSWVVYLGGGLFSNFWKPGSPYTLEDKCIEIFHWRDGAYCDDAGVWQMDEARVDAQVAHTAGNDERRAAVLDRMLRLRDPQGVYAQGGCLDASRERPKSVWPHDCRLHFAGH